MFEISSLLTTYYEVVMKIDRIWLELVGLASQQGIFALENGKDKKILIFRSRNPLLYLSSLISKGVSNREKSNIWVDRRKLKLLTLETGGLTSHEFYYWCQKYKSKGYTFYPQCRVPQLILHTKVDYRLGYMVELRDKGYRSFVVGVFGTAEEAGNWIQEVYQNGIISHIVYANNQLTKDYLSSKV